MKNPRRVKKKKKGFFTLYNGLRVLYINRKDSYVKREKMGSKIRESQIKN